MNAIELGSIVPDSFIAHDFKPQYNGDHCRLTDGHGQIMLDMAV